MYKKLLDKIKEYKNICIYRHVRPDGDAVFSQFAIYQFIKDNFKGKNVKICGVGEYDLLPYAEIPSDSFIKKSLVIILDTASSGRVDDLSYEKGDFIIKIDHHPVVDSYADLEIVDDLAASTTQLIAKIFFSKEFKSYKLSKEVCMYLYSGIATDSINFSTSATTAETLMIASKLVEKGDFEIQTLNNYLYDKPLDVFKNTSKLRNQFKIKKNVGYVIADKDFLDEIKMNASDAKNAIDEFSHISGVRVWAVFAYNGSTGLFDASVRSNRKYTINTVCAKFNGGGHRNACGVKNLTLKNCNQLINELIKVANA